MVSVGGVVTRVGIVMACRNILRRQDWTSNWQGTESVNLSVAACCVMKTKTTPSLQLRTVGAQEGNRAEPVEIWKARNFIHQHSDEELSLTQVAQAVNISPNYFSERFKQVTGVNFAKYVARTRYERALALLRDPDLRVSEIAFAAGFQSLSQFNRVFKTFSGKSPTAFRAATCTETLCRNRRTHRTGAQDRSSILPGR